MQRWDLFREQLKMETFGGLLLSGERKSQQLGQGGENDGSVPKFV